MAAADYYTQVYTMFVGYYGRPPAQSGLDYYANLVDKAGGNLAVVIDDFFKSAESQAFFAGKTVEQQVNQIFQNLFGRDALPAGLNYWTGLIQSGQVALSQAAYTIAFNAAPADVAVRDAKIASAKLWVAGLDTTNEILVFGTDGGRTAGRDFLSTVKTSTAATQAAVDAALKAMVDGGTTNPGQTYTLTKDVDGLTGTSGNDTFKATINDDGTTSNSTFQTGDEIVGGAGVDTLELTVADYDNDELVALSGVERVFIRELDNGGTIQADLWEGVEQIWMNKSLENLDIEDVQNQVTIGVQDTKDLSLELTYADDALGSDEATQKFVFNNAGDPANDNTLELEVFTGGADQITAVEIDASGANSVDLYGDMDGFMESVKVTGTGSLYLEDDGGYFDEATTVDLSGNSGGVELGVTNEDVVVTGGSGDDTITLANGTVLTDKAGIALGAGDDSLIEDSSAGLGTDAVLDGGAGTDTISSTLLEVGNQANIQNWEILDIAGESRTVDASLFTKSTFKSLALSAATAGATTVTKLAGTSIVLDVAGAAAITNAGAITATLATATGTSDTGVINFSNDGDVTLAAFNTAGLETITINSNGENTADDNEITDLNTTDNVLTTIIITGDKEFTLVDVDTNTSAMTATADVASSLTLIDGSAATGDLIITAGTAAAIAGGFNTTYNSLTIKTGEGDDTVSIGGRGTVATGEGADTVNVAVAGVSVNVGVDEAVDTVNVALAGRFTSTAGDFTSSSRVTTISNLAVDDVIDLSDIEATLDAITDFTTTALTFGSLEAAINDAIDNGATDLLFFNWVDGNTYIVSDGSVVADSDAVVKLIGTYEDFTVSNGVITIA